MHCLVIQMLFDVVKWDPIMKNLQDDHALMNVDTEKKTLKYVSPAAESRGTCNSFGVTIKYD